MSVSSINNTLQNNAFSNFNTNSITPAVPQKTSEDKQKSNAYKYMLGATALAGLVALGIAGYKGHLGESVQKLLGGAEKEAGSINPKASGSPKPEGVPTAKTENVVTENIEEAAPLSKEETVIPKEEITVPKEEAPIPKEEVAVPKNEEAPIVEKQAEKAEEQVEEQVAKSEENIETTASEEALKAEKAAEIVAAKLEDLVPKEMIGYMKMTKAEIDKLPRMQEKYSEHIIETYSNGKPKYTIDCINYVRMYDEETGTVVKQLNPRTYYEYDPKFADRRLKYVSITPEGQINAISQDIKWDSENKTLEQIWYEIDDKTPSHLSESIYDPETKKCVKVIGYKGLDRNSGVSHTLNFDRMTGELIK